MTHKPIDFAKVETLRRHMLLTAADVADLFGVSRTTYYHWLEGKPLRQKNQERVRGVLKQLLAIMADHGWPMPEVIGADQKTRKAKLVALLQQET